MSKTSKTASPASVRIAQLERELARAREELIREEEREQQRVERAQKHAERCKAYRRRKKIEDAVERAHIEASRSVLGLIDQLQTIGY